MTLLQARAALALEYVKATDMSLTMISRLIGESKDTICNWTLGLSPISDADLLKLAYLVDHKTCTE